MKQGVYILLTAQMLIAGSVGIAILKTYEPSDIVFLLITLILFFTISGGISLKILMTLLTTLEQQQTENAEIISEEQTTPQTNQEYPITIQRLIDRDTKHSTTAS